MSRSTNLLDYGALTFDCFGTLVDWESGIWNALQPLNERLPADHALKNDRIAVLTFFIKNEEVVQTAKPTALYTEILADTYGLIDKNLGVEAPEEEQRAFGQSVGDWPVFKDTPEALLRLQKHFKLVILSNVDRESFGRTLANQMPEITFDAIYTAQDIGTYKPNLNNFEYMVERLDKDLGVPREKVIHTAYALYHDLMPAHKAGLASCWIERGVENPNACGGGDPKDYEGKVSYAWQFKTMGEMADYFDSLQK